MGLGLMSAGPEAHSLSCSWCSPRPLLGNRPLAFSPGSDTCTGVGRPGPGVSFGPSASLAFLEHGFLWTGGSHALSQLPVPNTGRGMEEGPSECLLSKWMDLLLAHPLGRRPHYFI